MTNQLNIAHHLELYHLIPASLAIADALDAFQTHDFALITDAGQPLTIVQKSHLEKIERTEARPLLELLDHLPPLLSIGEAITVLETDDLKLLLLLLLQAEAPGLLIKHESQISGILSLDTLVEAMPLSAIPPSTTKGLSGNFVASPRTVVYICHKCQPPSKVVGTQDTVPSCQIHPFLHKAMEREK